MKAIMCALLSVAVATQTLANPKIRDSFFTVYPNVNGSHLTTLPSNPKPCGICHIDFNGGGTRNPYGVAIQNEGNLNTETGRTNAIWKVRTQDQDTDGYTAHTELTDLTYLNTPTFPGWSAANYTTAQNISHTQMVAYLTPSTGSDTNRPSITVTFPNGGETLTANRATNITWTASDPGGGISAIHIFESINGGATYTPVASGLPNTGSYSWVPANRPTNTARIKIFAVDTAGNTSNDVSNASFNIVSPTGGVVQTTLRDFDMPGTQPFQAGPEFESPENCAVCHGNYSASVEPYRNWQGSMMAHASRDPLFEANMAIANQDAPDSGDLCLRCHFANGWLQGRSVPTDGSRMIAADRHGVSCELCHRMVDPVYKAGISPAVDTNILAALTFPGTDYGNGMYVIDPGAITRGPFTNAAAPHLFQASAFHRSSAFCGTCHDVSNPVFTKDANGIYQPNSMNTTAGVYSAHSLGPVERTYSEWLNSAYNSTNGVYAPQFAGNKPGGVVSSCQDCHMRDVTGYGCNSTINTNPPVPLRTDLPLHDMTGGSTWLPGLLTNLYPSEVNAPAIAAGIQRATYMLENAARIAAVFTNGVFKVTVTNDCGHKLPTGYPEGRRIWVNVKFFDGSTNLLAESGAYNPSTGMLTHDTQVKIYEVHPGIGSNIAAVVNLPAGPSLHFVLNNKIYEDNRIPPRGFSNATYAAFGGAPVGHAYADGQYWDDTFYTPPIGTRFAEVRLYYQSTTKEFVEFLRDANTTNNKGQQMYDLWNNNGKCPPTLMAQTTWQAPVSPVFAGLTMALPATEAGTLTWGTASGLAPFTYRVYQSLTSGGQNFTLPVLTTSNLTAFVSPLDPGTTNPLTYYFVVRATDALGSTESNVLQLALQPLLDGAKDQDGDTIPNAFEQAHGLNPFDPFDADLDQDGDGFTSRTEYVAGTSPTNPGDYARIASMTGQGGTVRIRFATVTGRKYQVKWRATLTGNSEWGNVGVQVDGDGTEKEVTDTPEAGVLMRFYRVEITKP
jgi:hypothetical protein